MYRETRSAFETRDMYRNGNDTVIVKIKKSSPVRRATMSMFGAAAAPGATPSRLGALVTNGYVASIQPLFAPTIPAAAPMSGRLPLGMTAARSHRAEAPVKARKGAAFATLKLERGTNPIELAKHLNTLGDEIEIAYVPSIRYPMAKKKSKKKKKRTTGGGGKANDPMLSRQWGHGAVLAHDARAAKGFKDADDIVVAVVDSGIDRDHPDLQSCLRSYTNPHSPREDDRDYFGHGTHVTGIVAGTINNAVGISGLCAAKVHAVKALPKPKTVWTEEVYRAFLQALAAPLSLPGTRVVNLSLGGTEFDPAEDAIMQDLLDANIVVVAAMGNEFEEGNPTSYPAAYEGVIAVGATDEMDRRASFSNTGPHIAVVAPGERILSTVPLYPTFFTQEIEYDSWPGTSMATPHVAAAVALLLAKHPNLKPADVRKKVMAAADMVPGQTKFNEQFGAGRLNIKRLLAP